MLVLMLVKVLFVEVFCFLWSLKEFLNLGEVVKLLDKLIRFFKSLNDNMMERLVLMLRDMLVD